jgi:hypothetical protein
MRAFSAVFQGFSRHPVRRLLMFKSGKVVVVRAAGVRDGARIHGHPVTDFPYEQRSSGSCSACVQILSRPLWRGLHAAAVMLSPGETAGQRCRATVPGGLVMTAITDRPLTVSATVKVVRTVAHGCRP